jgi:ribosomal protein L11 methyltransferase
MTTTCYELVINVREEEKEVLTSTLNDLGEYSFVEGAIDCDLEFDHDELRNVDHYSLHAQGSPVILYSENHAHLTALENNLRALCLERIKREPEMILRPIADQNWRESWRASFKPVDVQGVFVILPPWENPAHFAQKHKIIIDPGMAFGTGQHETTKLCLELLLSVKGYNRVFDVGTGSGILAIAARMMQAPFVFGCDIDAESVSIAVHNAEKNNTPGITFVSTPIAHISETHFDLVFANIQAKPLRGIMDEIVKRTQSGGRIIFSGVLESELDDFCAFLESKNLEVDKRRVMGHWSGILCTKKTAG